MIRRYITYILGLYIVGLGVAMIIVSGLGTSPISSWAYVMSLNTPWTVGTFTFMLNVMLIAGQYLILHHHGLRREWFNMVLQIPFSFLFGAFIDLNLYLLRLGFTPETISATLGVSSPAYAAQMLCLLLGIAIQSIGLVLEVKPQVTMMSAEAFVFYSSRRWKQEFGKVKVWFDCALVLLAVVCSVGFALAREESVVNAVLTAVREGTLLAAILTGLFVRLLSRHVAPLDRFLFPTPTNAAVTERKTSDIKIIRATNTAGQAGAYYVRIQAMARKHHIPLNVEFDEHDMPDTKYIVAVDDCLPVATCRLYAIDDQRIMLGRIVVLPEYRHQGLGTRVVSEAEKWAREMGYATSVLESRDNKIHFYETMGYLADYSQKIVGETFTCYRMEKTLISS